METDDQTIDQTGATKWSKMIKKMTERINKLKPPPDFSRWWF